MKIEIDPTDFGLVEDPDTGELEPGPGLQDQLVNRIVSRLTDQARSDVSRLVAERTQEVVDEAVRERVRSVLDGLIQPVSHWNGKPEGEPFRIETMIETAVAKFIAAPRSRSDGYGNQRSQNMADLIDEMVKNALSTTLKPALEEAKKRMTNEIVRLALEGAAAAIAPKVR